MSIKNINKLAEQQFKDDLKKYDWMKEGDSEQWIKSNKNHLIDVRQALLKGRFYMGVESVSASGMSRVIKIAYIKNNELCGVSDDVYKLAGCDKNQRIRGCGMDMLFSAQYNLFQTLCADKRYQSDMPQYKSL